MFLNCQGVTNKFLILETFLSDVPNVNVVCMSEHWLKCGEAQDISLRGFTCSAFYGRTNHIRGGTLIFVRNQFSCRELDVSRFCQEMHFEVSATLIDNLKLFIVSIYHSTAGDAGVFLDMLDRFLLFTSKWSKYTILIGGDLNINFDITTEKNTAKEFLNILRQYNFNCLNKKPTRGKNCLDNVFINRQELNVKSNVFPFPYSDHDGLIVNIHLEKILPKHNNPTIVSGPNSGVGFKSVLPKTAIGDLVVKLNTYDWGLLLSRHISYSAEQSFNAIFNIFINNMNFFSVLKKK